MVGPYFADKDTETENIITERYTGGARIAVQAVWLEISALELAHQ